jgi:hypothetical protein
MVSLLLLLGCCGADGRRDACYCLVSLGRHLPSWVSTGSILFACHLQVVAVVLHPCCWYVVVVMAALMLYFRAAPAAVAAGNELVSLCSRPDVLASVTGFACSWYTGAAMSMGHNEACIQHNGSPLLAVRCPRRSVTQKCDALFHQLAAGISTATTSVHFMHTLSQGGDHPHARKKPLTSCARQSVARCTQPDSMPAKL